MSTITTGGKCPCGWKVPAVASAIVMPAGAKMPPEIYASGAAMLVMMKCTDCGRVMTQKANVVSGHVMSAAEALQTFEAFTRIAAPGGEG